MPRIFRLPVVTKAKPVIAGAEKALEASIATKVESRGAWSAPALATSTVDVPLIADAGKTVLVNTPFLQSLGLSQTYRFTPAAQAKLDSLFALRDAKPGETATATGTATVYFDRQKGRGYGAVRGDGRAVQVGEVSQRAPNQMPLVRDVQIKGGVVTGLGPVGASGDNHAGGAHPIFWGVRDFVNSAFLERSGIEAERAVAMQQLTPETVRIVRTTNNLRLAHLNALDGKPLQKRAILDAVNQQVSAELGRHQLLSLDGLYRVLVTRKTSQAADLFWAQLTHGSPTYDNIGLLHHIDLSTVKPRRRLAHDGKGNGYAFEPSSMSTTFAAELHKHMLEAAVGQERSALSRIDYETLNDESLESAMSSRMLGHLGLDEDDVARAMQTRKPQVREAWQTLFSVTTQLEPGPLDAWGYRTPRYELFAALSQLGQLAARETAVGDAVASVVTALKAITPDAAKDQQAARALYESLAPLVQTGLGKLSGPARAAKATLISDHARRINDSIQELDWDEWTKATPLSVPVVKALQAGETVKAQALIEQSVRRNLRQGPGSPMAVAMQLRHQELTPQPDGWVTLSSVAENGVVLREQSTGANDRLQVQRFQEATDGPGVALELSFGNGVWKRYEALPPVAGSTTWSVPLEPGALSDTLRARFIRGDTTVDNAGLDFGVGHAPVLGSPLVQAELAQLAHLKQETRPGAEALRAAVAAAPRQPRPNPTLPRELRRFFESGQRGDLQLPALER